MERGKRKRIVFLFFLVEGVSKIATKCVVAFGTEAWI
jgi:hypothetical protein